MAKKKERQVIDSEVKRLIKIAAVGGLEKPYELFSCGDCLAVQIYNGTGTAKWIARTKGQFITLGNYNKMPYLNARARVETMKLEAKAKKEVEAKAPVFSKFFNETYYPEKVATLKESSHQIGDYKRLFVLAEAIHNTPLNQITRKMIIDAMKAKPELSNNRRRDVINVVSRTLDKACNCGIIDVNPLKGMLQGSEAPFPLEKVKHRESVLFDDFVPQVMEPLKDCDEFIKACYLMIAFTGLRFGELRNWQWSWVNFENQMLVIPPEAAGANKHGRGNGEGRESYKPLTEPMRLLLQYLKAVNNRDSDFVFQSPYSNRDMAISDSALRKQWNAKVNNNGKLCDFHGIRTILRTWAKAAKRKDINGELVYKYTVAEAERAIDHDVSSQLEKTYENRELADEARPVLDAWNEWLITRLPNEFLELLEIGKKYPLNWG